MRISDWSSDVCSSDLVADEVRQHFLVGRNFVVGQTPFDELQQRGRERSQDRVHVGSSWLRPTALRRVPWKPSVCAAARGGRERLHALRRTAPVRGPDRTTGTRSSTGAWTFPAACNPTSSEERRVGKKGDETC